MAEEKNNKATENIADPKIDAIKQLIFGDNMTEYDQRFDDVLRQLEQIKTDGNEEKKELDQKISDQIATMQKHFETKIADLEVNFTKQIENLEDKKADRKALGKMLQNIAEKLQA